MGNRPDPLLIDSAPVSASDAGVDRVPADRRRAPASLLRRAESSSSGYGRDPFVALGTDADFVVSDLRSGPISARTVWFAACVDGGGLVTEETALCPGRVTGG